MVKDVCCCQTAWLVCYPACVQQRAKAARVIGDAKFEPHSRKVEERRSPSRFPELSRGVDAALGVAAAFGSGAVLTIASGARRAGLLRQKFSRDRCDPLPKGEFGGDLIQTVVGPAGQVFGSILWEANARLSLACPIVGADRQAWRP
jgi:hypothetical protein